MAQLPTPMNSPRAEPEKCIQGSKQTLTFILIQKCTCMMNDGPPQSVGCRNQEQHRLGILLVAGIILSKDI
jgi:hypothetical protein